MREFTQALRALWRDKAFTTIAIAMLALGIGANSALFTVLDAIALRPLPYEEPDQLIELSVSPRQVPLDLLANAQSLQGIAGFQSYGFNVVEDDGVVNTYAIRVSPNLFSVLGVQPALGRMIEPSDDGQPVVVLSYDYWRRRFGSYDILGESLIIDGQSRTIVGVAPADFTLQVRDAAFFVPHDLDDARVVTRLQPGVTPSQAAADVQALLANAALPPLAPGESYRATATPLAEAFRPNTATTLWLLLGGGGVMLLIVCANLANLLLVRSHARSKELAVRAALGAGRMRLAKKLLAENVLVALLGGAAGLVVIAWMMPAFESVLPANITRVVRGAQGLNVDLRIVAFTFFVAMTTAIVFGLAPLRAAWRSDLAAVLRGASAAGAAGRGRFGMTMAAAEIALAVTLLTAAGLTIKNVFKLQARDLGFSAQNVLRVRFFLPEARLPSTEARRQRVAEVIDRVEATPGVELVGALGPQLFPFGGPRVTGSRFAIRGREGSEARAEIYTANPDYLRAVEIPLLAGRWISGEDNADSLPVVVLSEIVAKTHWGRQDPLGALIRLDPSNPDELWRTVVGIVGDVRNPVGANLQPTGYIPLSQSQAQDVALMVKASSSATALAEPLRATLQAMDPSAPAPRIADLERAVDDYISPERFTTSIYSLLAALGLLIAGTGVYGVMAYWAKSRESEMGIRMALGARSSDILSVVLSSAARIVAAGLMLGLFGAWSLQRFIASELHDVDPFDPAVVLSVAIVMALVALGAALRPALRASRANPAVAIRNG